jgi:predicted dehydrogenase
MAEGGWEYAAGFGFSADFRIAMEKATLQQKADGTLWLHPLDGESRAIDLPQTDAYVAELEHFVDCIKKNKKSDVVTPESALASVKLVEAELKSVASGKKVSVGK